MVLTGHSAATITPPRLLPTTIPIAFATSANLRGTVACATGSENVADTLSGSKGEALAVGAGLTGQPCKEYKATEAEGCGKPSQAPQSILKGLGSHSQG
jgi:hypothetical protein